jgi:hypothetical protein
MRGTHYQANFVCWYESVLYEVCSSVYSLLKAPQQEYARRDNLRQEPAIWDDPKHGWPGKPQGRRARHWVTLAALIIGIVASQSTRLPKITSQLPNGAKSESRVICLARWIDTAPLRRRRSLYCMLH